MKTLKIAVALIATTLIASSVSADFWHDVTAPVRGTGRLLSGESSDDYENRKLAKEERIRQENLAKEERLREENLALIKQGRRPN